MAKNHTWDDIEVGDKVTIANRFNQRLTGRAVMLGPGGWVLNMGGRHGQPGICSRSNFESVRKVARAPDSLATRRLRGGWKV